MALKIKNNEYDWRSNYKKKHLMLVNYKRIYKTLVCFVLNMCVYNTLKTMCKYEVSDTILNHWKPYNKTGY